LFEGKIANRLLRSLPGAALLQIGNSMPVRDLDTYGGAFPDGTRVDGNRGANGIDGVVSTAAGAAMAAQLPTFLYLGDLSFLHDLSGLQLVARHSISLTVVVANNAGGGIFESLPQAQLGEQFERLFATPHGCDLAGAVSMCGGHFKSVSDWKCFDVELADCRDRSGLNVIEVKTDRAADARRRRVIVTAIVRRIDEIPQALS
jgi:2-succinyl-5-enolpyruvyl-6-hydroxy-3-cyclohexene-1-carboxylate synthase